MLYKVFRSSDEIDTFSLQNIPLLVLQDYHFVESADVPGSITDQDILPPQELPAVLQPLIFNQSASFISL